MVKAFVIVAMLSFQLLEYSLAYPRRHKIAKNIRHVTTEKDHPCMMSKEENDRPYPVGKLLEVIHNDTIVTKHQIGKILGRHAFRGKEKITIFKLSALCGEEILYDMSLVLEYFRDELTKVGEQFEILQSKLILEREDPLKPLLYRTINDITNSVTYLRRTKTVTLKRVPLSRRKTPSSGKMLKKYLKIVSNLEHFVASSITIINLK